MNRAWLKSVAGVLVVVGVLFGLYRARFAPNDWDLEVFRTIETHLAQTGLTHETNALLRSLSDSVPIYIAEYHAQTKSKDAIIVASNYEGAVGIQVAAFRDQMATLYVSRGPVTGAGGQRYMVYIAK